MSPSHPLAAAAVEAPAPPFSAYPPPFLPSPVIFVVSGVRCHRAAILLHLRRLLLPAASTDYPLLRPPDLRSPRHRPPRGLRRPGRLRLTLDPHHET
uniref:Uncharacterized protein n=1 Tax=Oryza glumipatula TaxID=40148 RepID=A0A0E0AHZ0_9ORYZ